MPHYDYQCLGCGHVFEVFQSMTAEPVKTCPQCGAEVKRLIGAGSGLIFKGSGFYITDYKNKNTSSTPASGSSKSASNGKNGQLESASATASTDKAKKTETKSTAKKND